MLFTSFEFIAFIIGLFVLYYLIPKRFQWVFLLVANVVFYACAGWGGMIFIAITIVTSYVLTLRLDFLDKKADAYRTAQKGIWTKEERKAYKAQVKKKKWHSLLLCLFINIGILVLLKCTNFILPMGISFYTFQTMGYVIDVYRGKVKAERNFFKMALFTSFFPQLVQGPISRFADLSQTLYAQHSFCLKEVLFGVERILWGYFKKLVIADRMLTGVTAIIAEPSVYSGFYVFCGMIFYAIELYADFTGGIDITIGVAEVLGIRVTENFERPYFSKNIAEYWRRWHITMGTWFKDYMFYPMSVSMPMLKFSTFSRKHFGEAVGKRLPVYVVTMVVWFATGFWHGAGWNFIVWGLLNGIVILVSQELRPLYDRFHKRFPGVEQRAVYKAFQVIRTILLMSALRTLDCYRNVPLTVQMFGTMFTDFNIRSVLSGGLMTLGLSVYDYIVIAVGVLVMFGVSMCSRSISIRERLYQKPVFVQYAVVFLLFFTTLIFGAYGIGYDASQFIYNQF